ncbi:MAG: glycosyltransferase family 2 protein [Myxococcota bacterium]
MTALSVVVVTWETRDLTLRCLEVLSGELTRDPALSADVHVVDNGSRDGTAPAVRERFPDVEVIELPENRGYAAGNNAGLAACRGDVVLLLNTDAEITREAIDRALDLFAREPGAGVVGLELRHPDGRPQNAVHAFPGPLRELAPRWLLEGLWPARFPSKRRPMESPAVVEAVLGAALFARAEAVREVGPLDDGYFFFLEETDWCWRMEDRGWQVWHLPGAPVRHGSGQSSKRPHPAPTRIEYHRSLYRFVERHRGRAARNAMVAIRVVRTLGTALLLLPLAPFSSRQRRRFAERAALLAWHARGRPATGGLREVAPATGSR